MTYFVPGVDFPPLAIERGDFEALHKAYSKILRSKEEFLCTCLSSSLASETLLNFLEDTFSIAVGPYTLNEWVENSPSKLDPNDVDLMKELRLTWIQEALDRIEKGEVQ